MKLPAQLKALASLCVYFESACLQLALMAAVFFVAWTDRGALAVDWKTGAALDSALRQAIGVTWHERGLRDGLGRISQETGVAIFLDRRIDPDQELSLQQPPLPLDALLHEIAVAASARSTRLGPVIYIGPKETADELATVSALRKQDVSKLPPRRQAELLAMHSLQWEELSSPAQLVEQLAREAGVNIANIQAIPHDLWPAVKLPPLPWSDRLTLVLAGFGHTFELDAAGETLRLTDIPSGNVIERRYSPPGSPANLAVQLKRVLPDAETRVERGQLIVRARQEDQEQIDRLLAGQPLRSPPAAKSTPTKKAGELLFTLSIRGQPAGAVVRKVAESLSKRLVYDETVLESLQTPITLDLKEATAEHLLDRTLKPLGLSYRFAESELIVSRAP